MILKLRLLIFFFILFFTCNVSCQSYGVQFDGEDVILDKRTSLDLFPKGFKTFDNEFELSFDIRQRKGSFGYVFRIINDENHNIDLISNPDSKLNFSLVNVSGNKIIPIETSNIPMESWIHIRVIFKLSEQKIVFYVYDEMYVLDDLSFKEEEQVKIFFGAADYKLFKTRDVPSMSIKDIKLIENGKLEMYFPLSEIEGTVALDIIGLNRAELTNPNWIAENHSKWKLESAGKSDSILLSTFNEVHNILYLISKSQLKIIDFESDTVKNVKFVNELKNISSEFSLVYNTNNGLIYCYSIDNRYVASLNPENGFWNWNSDTFSNKLNEYIHHNSYYSSKKNSLYTFGGYGQYKYTNKVFKLNFDNSDWKELNADSVVYSPRYLSGLYALNDTVYIFGGYGSLSGNQRINPRSCFDLLGYSVEKEKFFKKFEVAHLFDGMSVANTMWIDSLTRDFYALIYDKNRYNGELQLIKGSIDNNEISYAGNKIQYNFIDVKSNAKLFYDSNNKKLIVLTSYISDSLVTDYKLHSIKYPPNKIVISPKNDVIFEKENKPFNLFYYVIVIVLFGISILVFRKYKTSHLSNVKENLDVDTTNNSPLTTELEEKSEGLEELNVSKKTKSLPEIFVAEYDFVLFGGFQVFGKESQDITNKFSPLLKELFLLIWLNTLKNNKGVSSEKLVETLWYDKSPKSAQNNRAVNIAKLRTILSEVEGYDLTRKTGYWKLIHKEDRPRCDYSDLLKIASSKGSLSKDNIEYLMKISEKGPFLLNVNYEWLDNFKGDVSDIIIDALISFAEEFDIQKDPEFIIRLSDCVFNFDSINEEAMVFKCKSQYEMGKHSLAKSTYQKFEKEYELLYGQKFESTFLDIINDNV